MIYPMVPFAATLSDLNLDFKVTVCCTCIVCAAVKY